MKCSRCIKLGSIFGMAASIACPLWQTVLMVKLYAYDRGAGKSPQPNSILLVHVEPTSQSRSSSASTCAYPPV
eukprot:c31203_g1_i1 orf=164-382(-)